MPFQLAVGNQTSILISESLVGRNVAATRQNAGRFVSDGFGCAAVDPGGVNVPGETAWASVIVVCGNDSAVRLSHVAAFAGVAANVTAVNRNARRPFMARPVPERPSAAAGSAPVRSEA